MITKLSLTKYAFVGVINSLVVYAVYTPYVFLWVNYTVPQYIHWLIGGIPMSLGFGWLFALVVVKVSNWFDEKTINKNLSVQR